MDPAVSKCCETVRCEACQGLGYVTGYGTPIFVQRCDFCSVYGSDIEAAKVAAWELGVSYHCFQCQDCGYWDMAIGTTHPVQCWECGRGQMLEVDFPRPYGG